MANLFHGTGGLESRPGILVHRSFSLAIIPELRRRSAILAAINSTARSMT
jgi:hypothetical protein